jgi:hypothetical protein
MWQWCRSRLMWGGGDNVVALAFRQHRYLTPSLT